MNKFYIYGLTVLALGFTACDEIEEGTGLPQTNPQLPAVVATNVKAEAGPSAGSLISLDAYNNDGKQIELAKVTKGEDWPEGFSVNVPLIEVSKTADFSGGIWSVESSADADGMVLVSPDAWDGVYKDMFGKNPVATTSYVRFPVWAVKGSQKVRMGGLDTYYGDFSVQVKSFDLYNGRVVEDEYYLLTSDMNWDLSQALPMRRNSPDMDIYVDGRFTSPAVIVNGAGFEWMVVPGSAVAAGSLTNEYASFGLSEANDTEKSGALVANVAGSKAIPGLIDEAGPYVFEVNMETLEYKVQLAYENLWTPGDSNGWGFGTGTQMLYTKDYDNYYGYAHLNGSFKFTTEAGWGGINLGKGENPGELSSNGEAGNLSVEKDALYWSHVKLSALTYDLTEITTIGLIGDATPDGWGSSTALTPSADFLTWTATVELTAGEYKFRANDDWGINLGGSLDELTQDGANLRLDEAGRYVVTLDLSALPYSCTLVKQ